MELLDDAHVQLSSFLPCQLAFFYQTLQHDSFTETYFSVEISEGVCWGGVMGLRMWLQGAQGGRSGGAGCSSRLKLGQQRRQVGNLALTV